MPVPEQGGSERSQCQRSLNVAGAGTRRAGAEPEPVAVPGDRSGAGARPGGAGAVPGAGPGAGAAGAEPGAVRDAGPGAVRERCRRSAPFGAGSSPPQPRDKEPARPRRPGQERRTESTNTHTHTHTSRGSSLLRLLPLLPEPLGRCGRSGAARGTGTAALGGSHPLGVVDLTAAPPPVPAPRCRIFSQTFCVRQK